MPHLSHKIANRLAVAAVAAGLASLMITGLIGVTVMRRNLEFTDLVAHTYQVQDAINEFRILDERVETARRGYLLQPGENFRATFDQSRQELPKALERVAALTLDNPDQQARVARARTLLARQIAGDERSLRDPAGARADVEHDDAVAAIRDLRPLVQEMIADERGRLLQRNRVRLNAVQQLEALMVIAGLLTAGIGAGSLWVIFHYIADLNASRAALEDLNEGLEEEVRSRTGELRRANEEIQRFAYIVSHDLRSPLVNVMGFTSELEAAAKPLVSLLEQADAEAPQIVTPEARLAVTSDLPESLGFIRASTQKMDRLINAILRLSREGRRVLAPEAVDLTQMFGGLVATMQHRVDELGAAIEVAPGLPSVVSDRLALEQIFSNLLENALKYLKPGRPGLIRVSAHRRGERVVVEIADNGRGVDPKDHDRIFDLFRRSGAQDQPGEGIGLAHVRALGYRLGATVTVDSALDQGATFRVSLPAVLTNEAAA
jgi:signal transduction histidine kinase